MKRKLVVSFLVLASFFMLVGFVAPSSVFAQQDVVLDACDQAFPASSSGDRNTLGLTLCRVGFLINSVIPILISLGVVYFIWGVIHYAIARDEEAKAEGRGAMINGLIALLVIVSIWGLVNFMKSFIGLPKNNKIEVVCVPSAGVLCPEN